MPLVEHDHVPVFRVVRAAWPDPLDVSFSRNQSNRWNPRGAFAALYTCCSPAVARAIVLDIFNLAAIDLADLQPDHRPQLVEIDWSGPVVDMASAAGIVECGFPLTYPDRIEHQHTQPFASAWHDLKAEGVLCRSASLWRMGHRGWTGPHEAWGEPASFVDNATRVPILLRRRNDLDWLDARD